MYCLSKKDTEAVMKALKEAGVSVRYYHAGISAEKRRCTQAEWQAYLYFVPDLYLAPPPPSTSHVYLTLNLTLYLICTWLL